MNIGKYIFAQIIDFLPRYRFDKLVKKYKGDWHAKDLTCYNQLLHLLFGQITGCDSIRDICLSLEAHGSSIYHLGIRKSEINPTYAVLTRREIIASTKSSKCTSSASSDQCFQIISRRNSIRTLSEWLLTMTRKLAVMWSLSPTTLRLAPLRSPTSIATGGTSRFSSSG